MFSVKKKFVLLVCLILAGLLCGCAGKDSGDAAPEKNVGSETDETLSTEETKQEPTVVFEAQDMEGNTVTSDIFGQSRLTMINVWATYCNPCLREMPELAQLTAEYTSEDFQLIGIISDVQEGADQSAMETAAQLIEQTGADYPHLLLNESIYYGMLTDVMAVPTTFFVDSEGNILDTVVGAMDKSAWKEKIDELLEELEN